MMTSTRIKKKFHVAWLIPLLVCNFPKLNRKAHKCAPTISEGEIRVIGDQSNIFMSCDEFWHLIRTIFE